MPGFAERSPSWQAPETATHQTVMAHFGTNRVLFGTFFDENPVRNLPIAVTEPVGRAGPFRSPALGPQAGAGGNRQPYRRKRH
jgi:hypothetical protein